MGLANPGITCADRHRANPKFKEKHKIGYKEIMLMVGGKGATSEYQHSTDQVFCFCIGNQCFEHPFVAKAGRGGVSRCKITDLRTVTHLHVAPEVLRHSDYAEWLLVKQTCGGGNVKLLSEDGKEAVHFEEPNSPPLANPSANLRLDPD